MRDLAREIDAMNDEKSPMINRAFLWLANGIVPADLARFRVVRMCAWCVPAEFEADLRALDLNVSHGICDECRKKFVAGLNALKA